jgi:hypothetical protein
MMPKGRESSTADSGSHRASAIVDVAARGKSSDRVDRMMFPNSTHAR